MGVKKVSISSSDKSRKMNTPIKTRIKNADRQFMKKEFLMTNKCNLRVKSRCNSKEQF